MQVLGDNFGLDLFPLTLKLECCSMPARSRHVALFQTC